MGLYVYSVSVQLLNYCSPGRTYQVMERQKFTANFFEVREIRISCVDQAGKLLSSSVDNLFRLLTSDVAEVKAGVLVDTVNKLIHSVPRYSHRSAMAGNAWSTVFTCAVRVGIYDAEGHDRVAVEELLGDGDEKLRVLSLYPHGGDCIARQNSLKNEVIALSETIQSVALSHHSIVYRLGIVQPFADEYHFSIRHGHDRPADSPTLASPRFINSPEHHNLQRFMQYIWTALG